MTTTPTPDDAIRRDVLKLLEMLGGRLRDASRAIDTSTPGEALPALAGAAQLLAPYAAGAVAHATWSDTKASWRAAREALVERFRPLYLAEVARFAEELRPRFESGELRGWRDGDDGDGPTYVLEALGAARFGLDVDEDLRGDDEAAYLVLACSPTADASADEWSAVQFHAQAAVARDVVLLARERRWYTPTPDEIASPGVEDPGAGAVS
jgi:hypothetical protein